MEESTDIINTNKKESQILNQSQNDTINHIQDNDFIENNKPPFLPLLEVGKKIRCPECIANNCTFKIDQCNYQIKSDCSSKHHCDMDLIEFIQKSNQHQDELIKCCNKDCKNNTNIEYCYCGKILCEYCMKQHIMIYSEKKNEIHNSIKFTEKDERCCCCKEYNRFWFFCQDCQQNLCSNCRERHVKHNVISQITNNVSQDELKEIKNKLKIQKENYEKVIKKIEVYFGEIKRKIELLKLHLKLLISINENVVSSFNKKCINHEMISNLKNLSFNFDDKITDFKNCQNTRDAYILLLYLSEYQNNKENNYFHQNTCKNYDKYIEISHDFVHPIKNFIAEEQITSYCEMKKNNLLAFGAASGKIYLYEINKNYIKADFDIINKKENENKPVLYLSELKNGNLLACTKDYFKIYNIVLGENSICDEFQTFDYKEKNTLKPKVLEISNENLLSIDGKMLVLWRKNLNNNIYNEEKKISIDDGIYELFKMNNRRIFVYTNENHIKVFDTRNFVKLIDEDLNSKNNNKINISDIIKIEIIKDEIIMIVETKKFIFYSLITKSPKIIRTDNNFNIEGISIINDCRNKFYLYYNNTKDKENSFITN